MADITRRQAARKRQGAVSGSGDKSRGFSTKPQPFSPLYAKRIASAKRGLKAIRSFHHNEPTATEVAARYGIEVRDASRLLIEIFGDAVRERSTRGSDLAIPLFGRGLGLGNIISFP